MGESNHIWRTPTVVLKNSPSWLFKSTALLEFPYSAWIAWTRPSSMLQLLNICYRPACQTLSNAFLKPMKMWDRSCWCCRCFSMTWPLNICSTALRPGLKPACSSASSPSALTSSRSRITRSMILLGWLIRLIVRLFVHCSRLPFFGKGMTSDCVHSFGLSFVSQIFLHVAVRNFIVASPPFLSSTEGMFSTVVG